MPDTQNPGLTLRYEVQVDGIDLGAFTGLDGLSVEYEVTEYAEGGNNAYVHRLPGRVKYGNIKLTRPVDSSSGRLAAWFTGLEQSVTRRTASITVYDGNRQTVASWNVEGVWPVKYTGPTLSSDDAGVAKEVLELAHNGFTLGAG